MVIIELCDLRGEAPVDITHMVVFLTRGGSMHAVVWAVNRQKLWRALLRAGPPALARLGPSGEPRALFYGPFWRRGSGLPKGSAPPGSRPCYSLCFARKAKLQPSAGNAGRRAERCHYGEHENPGGEVGDEPDKAGAHRPREEQGRGTEGVSH